MKSVEWNSGAPISPHDNSGAYGPSGYVAKFGAPDEVEMPDIQKNRRRSRREEPSVEEMDDNDWTVTYTDMVTLLMAFFVMLTSLALIQKNENVDPRPPTRHNEAVVAISPFEGMGITPVEGGMPANRDPVVSQYDDPEAEASITDPAPSGHAHMTDPQPEEQPQPQPQPLPQPLSQSDNTANTQLAERLQALVRQNNLGGQVEIVSGAASVTVRISDRILFQSGKAELEGAGQELIARLLPMLNQPGQILSVEGHTDNIPISTTVYPSNWELSAARAAMVLRQLVSLGLPADRLRAIAFADTKPVGPNDTPEHRAANRRVELVITGEAPSPQP